MRTKHSKIGKIKVSSENQCRYLQRCVAKSCLTSTGDFCGNANIIGRKRKITENCMMHITTLFWLFSKVLHFRPGEEAVSSIHIGEFDLTQKPVFFPLCGTYYICGKLIDLQLR